MQLFQTSPKQSRRFIYDLGLHNIMVHDLEVPTRLREILMLYIVAIHISDILTTM